MTINEFIDKYELKSTITLVRKGNLRAVKPEPDVFAVWLGRHRKSTIFQFTKGIGLRVHKINSNKHMPFTRTRVIADLKKLENDYKPVAPTMEEALISYLSDAQMFLESPSYEAWKEEWDDTTGFIGCRQACENLGDIIGHRAIILAPVHEWQEELEESET